MIAPDINAGLVRCEACGTRSIESHPVNGQECRDLQDERAFKRMGDW